MTKILKLLLVSVVLSGCQGAYDKKYQETENTPEVKTEMENSHQHKHDCHHKDGCQHKHHKDAHKAKKADLKHAASPDQHITKHIKDTTGSAANTAAAASIKK